MTPRLLRSDIALLSRALRRDLAVLKWMAVANLAATSVTLAVVLTMLFHDHQGRRGAFGTLSRVACCSGRKFDVDQRGKALNFTDSEKSYEHVERHRETPAAYAVRRKLTYPRLLLRLSDTVIGDGCYSFGRLAVPWSASRGLGSRRGGLHC